VLYELLAGRPAFAADTPLATLELVRTADPPPLRQARPDVPADLETVCLKCLSKRPAERYASAGEVADELARALRGEPVRARRATAAERLVRGVRRHPLAAGLAAALLLTLAGALGVTGVLLDQTRRERDRAVQYLGASLEERDRAVAYLRESLDDTSHQVVEVIGRHEWMTADRQAFRVESLQGLRARLERIASHLDTAAPTDRPMLAECELRLSDVANALGERRKSHGHAERAVELFTLIASDRPDDPVMWRSLMAALLNQLRAEDRPAECERLQGRVTAVVADPHGRTAAQVDEDGLMVGYGLYDVAVLADRSGDPHTARGFVTASTTVLDRPTLGDDDGRRLRAYQIIHNHQLLCQIERCAGDLKASEKAGKEAVRRANEACEEWSKFYQSWCERCGAHFQCGQTLKVKGELTNALKVWEAGYVVPAHPLIGSPTYDRLLDTTLKQTQLVLAYHLGLGYCETAQTDKVAEWFAHVVKLGGDLRVNCPNDWQSRYYYGIGCYYVAALVDERDPSALAVELPRLHDGLKALEQCLAERPADGPLASALGASWELYARGLFPTGDGTGARAAADSAIRRQWQAFLARPDCVHGGRLFSHLGVRLWASGRNGAQSGPKAR
jgi:hypothetical protein